MDKVRTAFIGVGYRGKQLFRLLQNIPFFQVQAVADPGVKSSEISGIPCYNQGEDACLDMLKEHHPELVFIASPWQYHVQHALLCVEHGCHVALEIKGGLYIDEYTPLMELAEQHGCRVYPLENTLFMRENLSILNIVESGLLGEIVYMRGGYRHDLRHLLLDDAGNIGNREKTESVWRSKFYQEENGDLYPTHGLAPLCMIAGINRKDRIRSLTSFASKPAGMLQRIKEYRCRDTDGRCCHHSVGNGKRHPSLADPRHHLAPSAQFGLRDTRHERNLAGRQTAYIYRREQSR